MVCAKGPTENLVCHFHQFEEEKLDIFLESTGTDERNCSQILEDASKVILKFELNRFAPLVWHRRGAIDSDDEPISEAFSMTDLLLNYFLLDNNISSFFISTSSGSLAIVESTRQYTIRLREASNGNGSIVQHNSFNGYTDISVGEGTAVAATFSASRPGNGMYSQSWFALLNKLSGLLGVATGHLQRHSAVVSSTPHIGHVRPVRITRRRIHSRAVQLGLLQQIPGHRLSAEAVDRWLDLASDMGFRVGSSYHGDGASNSSVEGLSFAGLLHRSWLMGAPWLSLSLVVTSSVDKKRKQTTLAYTMQIQARLNTDSAAKARDTVLEKHRSSRHAQQKILLSKLQDLVSLELPSTSQGSITRTLSSVGVEDGTREERQQKRLACPRILTARRVVLESRSSLYFKVEDRYSMKIPSSNGIKAASAATIAITETLPEFYDILLSKYTYHLLVSAKDANMSAGGTLQATKSVIDLPSFRYSTGDCLQKSLPSSSSFFCERQITWSVNLTSFLGRIPLEESVDLTLLARFTAVRRFIKREFQPADASRGLLLPAAMSHLSVYYHRSHQADDVIMSTTGTSSFPSWCVASIVRQDQIQAMALSNSALLTMPVPDMSMPYNVITLVSTFAAFFLGSIVNALYRRRTSS